MLAEVVLEGLPTGLFDEISSEGDAVVGVAGGGAWAVHGDGWVVSDVVGQRHVLEIRAASVETSLETCGVGEQVAQCDWFTVVFLDRDIGVGGDVGVEVEFALFDELHSRDGGGDLRDRSPAEHSGFRVHRHLSAGIGADGGVAIASAGEDLAVLDHHNHGTGKVAIVEGIGELPVEPGIDVGLGELMCPGWWGHWWWWARGRAAACAEQGQYCDEDGCHQASWKCL